MGGLCLNISVTFRNRPSSFRPSRLSDWPPCGGEKGARDWTSPFALFSFVTLIFRSLFMSTTESNTMNVCQERLSEKVLSMLNDYQVSSASEQLITLPLTVAVCSYEHFCLQTCSENMFYKWVLLKDPDLNEAVWEPELTQTADTVNVKFKCNFQIFTIKF